MNYQAEYQNFLNYCTWQKHLNSKTVKAYRIDIMQFQYFIPN